jgi:hypothetical protein
MRDSEQQYPKHQPGRGERDHHDPFDGFVQEEGELEEAPHGGPVHQRETPTTPQLPRHHVQNALIIGIVAGVLASVQGIIITLVNAGLYEQVNKTSTSNLQVSIASALLGITCLSLFISAVIYFLAGLVIGKVAVHRRWAFIGGFLGGVVSSIIGGILKQIPSYPNASNTGFTGGLLGIGGGLVALLIGTIVLSVIVGCISLLGAWLTTRRHPYYVGYNG